MLYKILVIILVAYFQNALAENYPPKNCTIALIGKPICTSCSGYKICMPNNIELPAQTCPTDKPYCIQSNVGDNCAIRPDLNVESCKNMMDKPNPIDCSLGKIYVPDPKYCNFYQDCKGFGSKSVVSACPHDAFYNYRLERCDSNLSQKCNLVNCSRASIFSPYGDGFNRWYAYCDSFSGKITMFQCRAGFRMNFTTNMCEFVCPSQRNGNFCDKTNYSLYYECYGPKNDWDQIPNTIYCPPGYVFHFSERRCTLTSLAASVNRYPNDYASCNYVNRV